MIDITIHLTQYHNTPVPSTGAETRVVEHLPQDPYVEAKLTLGQSSICLFVNSSEVSLSLAAALEHIASTLRTYEASLPRKEVPAVAA